MSLKMEEKVQNLHHNIWLSTKCLIIIHRDEVYAVTLFDYISCEKQKTPKILF